MDTLMTAGELIKKNKLMMTNGVIQIVNHDNRKTINTVNNPQGTAISFGDCSTNTITNNYGVEIEDLTKNLLELLKSEEMDPSDRTELTDLIEVASQTATTEQPKKAVVKNLLKGSKELIDTAAKSPALIEAYVKWATFIQNIPVI